MNINKAKVIINRCEKQVITRKINDKIYPNLRGIEIPVIGTSEYKVDTISSKIRPLTTKNVKKTYGLENIPVLANICTPDRYIYLVEEKPGKFSTKNLAKIMYVLREQNLLKNVTVVERPVTQQKIKALVSEYRENGDKLRATVLQNYNNSRHKDLRTLLALHNMLPSELKKRIDSTSKMISAVLPSFTDYIMTLANKAKEAANPQSKKEEYAGKFSRVFLPKRYKGNTEQTLNTLEKAASNPEMRDRLALNKILHGEIEYHQ